MTLDMHFIIILAGLLAMASAIPRRLKPSTDRSSRIIGGYEIDIEMVPYQLMLRRNRSFICGASLIAPNVAMTAAHCVDSSVSNPGTIGIVCGLTDRTDPEGDEQEIFADSITVHEDWQNDPDVNGAAFPNDIALVHLRSSVTQSAECQVGRYDQTSNGPPVNDQCMLSGWGKTDGGILGDTADILKGANVTVISNTECGVDTGATILAGQICFFDHLEGSCNGDSGGPSSCEWSGSSGIVISGITSWGIARCPDDRFPSCYTRVAHYKNWILTHMP